MKTRKLTLSLILACGFIAAALAVFLLVDGNPDLVPVNIIPDHGYITQEDYWHYIDRQGFDHPDPASLFEKGLVNKHTLPFFFFLNETYRGLGAAEQSEAVRAHMQLILATPEKAQRMFELYRAHEEYRKELMGNHDRWFSRLAPGEMIATLRDLQKFRRVRFGREAADALFGVEVKSLEYTIRKHAIITGKRAGGIEKEKRLARLRLEMWGDQSETIDSRLTPAQRCEEKINIYENDFADLGEKERLDRIRGIRLEFFPPEEVNRLEGADRRSRNTRKKDRDYYRRSRPILDARDLTETEKNEKLMDLQNEIYGAPGGSGLR